MAGKEKKPWADLVERIRSRLPSREGDEPSDDGLPHLGRMRIRTGYDPSFESDAWDVAVRVSGPAEQVVKVWLDVLVLGLGDTAVESWLLYPDADGWWRQHIFENNPEMQMPPVTSRHLDADAPFNFQLVFGLLDTSGRLERRVYA